MLESKVAEMLGQLADKLGVASAKIWEWSLLQVKVEIVTSIVLAVIALIISVSSVKVLKRYAKWKEGKKKEDRYFDSSDIDMAVWFGMVPVVGFDIFSVLMLCKLPKLILNPEYAAFQNILEQLGSLK